MANTSHPTGKAAKSKPTTTGPDNRKAPAKTSQAIERLVGLGVPRALADTFPLTPHPTGRWCKKLRTPHGPKIFYFGALADWQGALDRYRAEKEDMIASRTPTARNKDGLRLLDLCNRWLHHKRQLVQTGELALRTWYDYHGTAERLLKVFGKEPLVEDLGPDDFEKLRADFGKTLGPVKIGNEVTRTRMIFAYAFESNLLERPVRYGPTFKGPNRKTLRRVKRTAGLRMFEAHELRRIINAAEQPMKAMILLAANGGLGNHDLATLPLDALDLDGGWIDFPRPKTGVDRKIPLWSETVEALKGWLAVRPLAKYEHDEVLVFLTRQRRAWFRSGRLVEQENGGSKAKGFDSPVSKVFGALLERLEINGQRNFYAIRHGFETVAGDTGDQVAVDHIMGHSDQSMAARYRERIDPARLRRVVEQVRRWLFGLDETNLINTTEKPKD